MEKTDYTSLKKDFYDKQCESPNPLRSWFHRTRHSQVGKLVRKYRKDGDRIIDIGCGNCLWNVDRLPVVGIDFNADMLEYAKKHGRLSEIYAHNLDELPIDDRSVDIIIASEVLEHLPNNKRTILEMYRVLRPGGIAIVTVPHDTLLSLWKPLFAVQCFLQGYVYKDEYYRNKCGHIHHFSPKNVRNFLKEAGFKIEEQFSIKRFTIYTVASKAAFHA